MHARQTAGAGAGATGGLSCAAGGHAEPEQAAARHRSKPTIKNEHFLQVALVCGMFSKADAAGKQCRWRCGQKQKMG